MGAVRYKYQFERAPTVEEIADRFRALTGLTMIVEQDWELRAPPLRGSVELERGADTLWVIPWHKHWISSSYFLAAFKRTLHELGAKRPPPRLPGYAMKRWADLPAWRRWLNR